MKFATLYLCAFLCALVRSREARPRKVRVQEEPTNNIFFEKIEYRILDRSVISKDWIDIRPIAPNVYRVNATVEVAQTINESWASVTLYYKYTTYQKFLISFKHEGCSLLNALLDDNSTSPFKKIILDNTAQFIWDFGYETNFQYKCPVEPDELYAWHEGINVSRFSLPLMPAGRYRVNMFGYTSEHALPYVSGELYFRISDLRIWF